MPSTTIHKTALTSNLTIEVHAKETTGLNVSLVMLGSDRIRPTQLHNVILTLDEARFLIETFADDPEGAVKFYEQAPPA